MIRIALLLALLAAVFALGSFGRGGPDASPAATTADGPSPMTVSIAALLAAPERYEHQLVSFEGRAAERIVLVGYGGFRVVDLRAGGTAGILVTSDAAAPAPGTGVSITGRFRVVLAAGNTSVAAITETRWRETR